MNQINIHYHLAVPCFLCILFLFLIIIKRNNLFKTVNKKWLWLCITLLFLLLYLFIIGTAFYKSIYYQWDIIQYDLDGDGVFGSLEITKEQESAMFRLTNDIGRNYSFISGFCFAALVAVPIYVIGEIIIKIRQAK